MLNFKVCRKCEHCNYNPPVFSDDDGTVARVPLVYCDVAQEMLVMSDTVPDLCPNDLEHFMSMQDADKDLISSLSGGQ